MRFIVNIRGLLAGAVALCALGARAQTFPADSDWTPLHCGGYVMTDPYRDESSAVDERDLVGNVDQPTGYRASDGQYLYLRVRLDQDPMPGGAARPFAWGLLLDRDGDLKTYEVQILASGVNGTVELYQNTVTTLLDDPTDPPDEPALKTYQLSKNARSKAASGSSFGGNTDYFLDFAIPWQDLGAVQLSLSTPVTAWAATSSNSNTLNGDFACWNDALGNPTLSGTDPGVTTLDPRVDSDGDGYTDQTEYFYGTDPRNASDHPSGTPDAVVYAGGGGCSSANGPAMLGLILVLAAWAAGARRRARLAPGLLRRR
ncbi:MAG TPA: thrombospondin type 3 repeat-containing protein [Gemmatimonadales bacterium]|nr:thrombospondin type 3 repeat-containing protein [Gemmatimonadales bacterium]